MHINPKKSWHVFSEENVKKVLKDEQEHREEEERKEKRRLLAEQERRIETLRKVATERSQHTGLIDSGKKSIVAVEKPNKHINFFEAEEKGVAGLPTNEEYEAEKSHEKKKWEDKFTSYLGQGSNELASDKPFYLRPTGFEESKVESQKDLKRREARLRRLDPLTTMNDMLGRCDDAFSFCSIFQIKYFFVQV
eukprot:c20311_g1_i2.p2 GENE.c20311_g1_i2~~c20311_g1_i2.p2  ORF type:complete len:193 (+),score=45.96 c20311_g1_i2:18-596(+)